MWSTRKFESRHAGRSYHTWGAGLSVWLFFRLRSIVGRLEYTSGTPVMKKLVLELFLRYRGTRRAEHHFISERLNHSITWQRAIRKVTHAVVRNSAATSGLGMSGLIRQGDTTTLHLERQFQSLWDTTMRRHLSQTAICSYNNANPVGIPVSASRRIHIPIPRLQRCAAERYAHPFEGKLCRSFSLLLESTDVTIRYFGLPVGILCEYQVHSAGTSVQVTVCNTPELERS